MAKEVKQWITVNGVHVPIFEGESKAEAVKRAVNKQKSNGKAQGKTKEKSSNSKWMEDIDDQELDEIADRYNTSKPVSGNWNTETEHEQKAIASKFDLTMDEAKEVMKKRLGFDDSDFKSAKKNESAVKEKTETQKQISKDNDEKEKQIARNKKEADERKEQNSNSEFHAQIGHKISFGADENGENSKVGTLTNISKDGKTATVRVGNKNYKINSDGQIISNDRTPKIDTDKLYDIAERYNTSYPVSGNWDDETSHEQRAIAKEFGISLSQAKKVMIDKLGFPEKLEEGDHWATESKKASNKKNKLSFSADEASKKINSISMAHNNRGGDTENDWKQIRDTLENAPVGTVMIQTGDRGVKFQHTKGQDGKWHDGKGWDADSKTMSMGWVGQGYRPTVEFTTSDKALTSQQIKDTHDAATSGKLNQHLGLDKNGKKIGNRSVPKISSSKQNKIKKILGDDKKMAEWKINKAYDRTSLKELALEAGMSSSFINAMTTDDLRAKLLAMWNKG